MLEDVLPIVLMIAGVAVGSSRLTWFGALLILFWAVVVLTIFSRYLTFSGHTVPRLSSQHWAGTPEAIIKGFLLVGVCYAVGRTARWLARRRKKRAA